MTRKQEFIEKSKGYYSKVILGLRMPDNTKEVIINDNVFNKVEYVTKKYDENLQMHGSTIKIEEYLFIKK